MNSVPVPENPAPSRWGWLLFAAMALAVTSFLFCEIYEYDIWWHVAIGRDILATWSVPVTDRFAAAAAGRPYHDSHWLFQVVVALADRAAGMLGVQLVMVSLWAGILALGWRSIRCRLGFESAAVLVFIMAMACVERFLPRPELVTFVGVAFFYWRFQAGRFRSRLDLLLLFAIQVAWVNSHGLFVIGPFIAGCYWLANLFAPAEARKRDLRPLSVACAVVLLATLLTPYGWGNWEYAFLLFREAGPNAPEQLKNVGELSPTFGAASRGGIAFWFYLLLLAGTAVATACSISRIRYPALSRTLVLLGLLAASLTGRRNMVLFALAAAPFAAEMLAALPPARRQLPRGLTVVLAAGMLAWAWFPLSGTYHARADIPGRFGMGATPSYFPHNFPAFLERVGFRGQMFTSNHIGGFYLYHGYPGRIPFTDGRWEIYDLAIFPEIRRAAASPQLWREFAARHAIDGMLLQHTTSEAALMLPWLRTSPDWKLVYLDAAASCWLPADAPVPALGLDPAGPLPAAARLDDCLILDLFYQQAGADRLRVRNLERALTYGRRTEQLLTSLGQTLVKMARYDEAATLFERLHREYPRNLVALNELAFVAFQRGDAAAARQFLQRALEIDPHNAEAAANLARLGGK